MFNLGLTIEQAIGLVAIFFMTNGLSLLFGMAHGEVETERKYKKILKKYGIKG